MTKVIERINERLELEGVYFPIQERYQTDDLKKIQAYLETEVEGREIKFIYGKGTRKSAIQRDYEEIATNLEKLTQYEKYLAVIGPDRNSCAKTDGDATFMRMKEDHMRNGQLKAGYNVQIGVADEYILHLDIFQDRSDYRTFIPFLEGYQEA